MLKWLLVQVILIIIMLDGLSVTICFGVCGTIAYIVVLVAPVSFVIPKALYSLT